MLKRDVTLKREAIAFDYIAKEGKRRTITIADHAVRPVVRALIGSDSPSDTLFNFDADGRWQPLRSHDVSTYIAANSGGHYTAKEFRTWNATVLMALFLANAEPAATDRDRVRTLSAGVREVATWLGDTPAVTRSAYIDPRVVNRYTAEGQLATIPPTSVSLPVVPEVEAAVLDLLGAAQATDG